MFGKRGSYSSAPFYESKRAKKKPGTRGTAGQPRKRLKRLYANILQFMFLAALPVLFILAMLIENTGLLWFFTGAAGLSMLLMWVLNAFVRNARVMLTYIFGALIIIALVAVWVNRPAEELDELGRNEYIASIFSSDLSAAAGAASRAAGAAAAAPDETKDPNSVSAAQLRLERFMGYWLDLDYSGIISLCLPSWVSAQENPESAVFRMLANRMPVSYEIENVSGNDALTARTITMTALIDRKDGSGTTVYRFQILMLRLNEIWYVDPRSLNSSSAVVTPSPGAAAAVSATPAAGAAVTTVPAMTIDPEMILYYNENGGQYYHSDPNCKSINKKFRPLKSYFLYRQINTVNFNYLSPCAVCSAPSR